MRRHILFTTALAMVLVSISTTNAQTHDIQFVSTTDFASVQDRIDELEGRLASYDNFGDSASFKSKISHRGSNGVVGGIGVAFLKAGQS